VVAPKLISAFPKSREQPSPEISEEPETDKSACWNEYDNRSFNFIAYDFIPDVKIVFL
jgi:hypothetical protein